MDPSIIDCADQLILRPSVTRVDGRPVLTKTSAVITSQNISPVVEMVLRDNEGRPINFSTCGFGTTGLKGKVLLKVKEAISTNAATPLADIEGAFFNAAAGVVRAKLPVTVTENNCIAMGNWGITLPSGELMHTTSFYIVVERNQFGTSNMNNNSGLPSIAEVRSRLRDSSPEDNPLLNTLEFDTSEICDSMIRCVQYWNTMQPRVSRTFNTTNFLNPAVLLDGIMGELYSLAAKHYRRNQLAYTAGGLSIDDKNKAQEYEIIGDKMLQGYLNWVKMTKVQINKEAWDGSFGSGYSSYGRHR